MGAWQLPPAASSGGAFFPEEEYRPADPDCVSARSRCQTATGRSRRKIPKRNAWDPDSRPSWRDWQRPARYLICRGCPKSIQSRDSSSVRPFSGSATLRARTRNRHKDSQTALWPRRRVRDWCHARAGRHCPEVRPSRRHLGHRKILGAHGDRKSESARSAGEDDHKSDERPGLEMDGPGRRQLHLVSENSKQTTPKAFSCRVVLKMRKLSCDCISLPRRGDTTDSLHRLMQSGDERSK